MKALKPDLQALFHGSVFVIVTIILNSQFSHGELFGRNTSAKDILYMAEEQGAVVYPIRFGEMPGAYPDTYRAIDNYTRAAADNSWSSADRGSSGGIQPPSQAPILIATRQNQNDAAKLLKRVREFFQALADKTGGLSIEVQSVRDLDKLLQPIVEELGQQYTLGYIPTDPPKNGEHRKIKVQVERPDVAVRARKEIVYVKDRR